jgi:hypothetical protein
MGCACLGVTREPEVMEATTKDTRAAGSSKKSMENARPVGEKAASPRNSRDSRWALVKESINEVAANSRNSLSQRASFEKAENSRRSLSMQPGDEKAANNRTSLGKKPVEEKDDDRNRVLLPFGEEDRLLEQVHIR